jgi:hypothetical protein
MSTTTMQLLRWAIAGIALALIVGSYQASRHQIPTTAICVSPPGKPRPSGFVTKKGDGYTLVSLKRWSVSK